MGAIWIAYKQSSNCAHIALMTHCRGFPYNELRGDPDSRPITNSVILVEKQRSIEVQNDDVFKLCDTIRETSYAIHCFLYNGHLEKVYENALTHRLNKAGTHVEQQYPLKVLDEDGYVLGEYLADLFVDNRLLVELKAVENIKSDHIAQLLGYMRAARVEHGLLINFGASKLQIRKFALSEKREEIAF